MLTALGDFLRRLRISHKEVLKDMADKLGVSSAFLSAVENGRKSLPEQRLEQIASLYHMNAEDKAELFAADKESRGCIELDIKHAGQMSKRLAITFARSFDKLDPETTDKILDLLQHKGQGKLFDE